MSPLDLQSCMLGHARISERVFQCCCSEHYRHDEEERAEGVAGMASRRVLITGASKGIGRDVAERLAAAGHQPVGLARTAPPDFPGAFHAVDLADRAATAATLADIVRDGTVDAVVNN